MKRRSIFASILAGLGLAKLPAPAVASPSHLPAIGSYSKAGFDMTRPLFLQSDRENPNVIFSRKESPPPSLAIHFVFGNRDCSAAVILGWEPGAQEIAEAWDLLAKATENPHSETVKVVWDLGVITGNEMLTTKAKTQDLTWR